MDPLSSRVAFGAASSAAEDIDINDIFSIDTYSGNGTTQTITNGINLAGQGGLVWIKGRNGSAPDHMLFDTERGVHEVIVTNSQDAAVTRSTTLTAFNSNGFTLGGYSYTNGNAGGVFPTSFNSYTFRNQSTFLDVVTYAGNFTVGRQVSHSLGSVPGMILVKNVTSGNSSWAVYHKSVGINKKLHLNNTDAVTANFGMYTAAPTSTTFTIGQDYTLNFNNNNYVAYVFADTPNLIKCSGGTSNGGSQAVSCGFQPSWLLLKRTSSVDNWYINDTTMTAEQTISTNSSGPVNTTSGQDRISLSATGFTIDNSNLGWSSGDTFIYTAIA